jgi:hypothetical protein
MLVKLCIKGVPATHINAQGCTAVKNKVRKKCNTGKPKHNSDETKNMVTIRNL